MKLPRLTLFTLPFAHVSHWLVIPLLGVTAAQYGLRIMYRPAAEVYSLTVTALGITAGLAAVCLSATITKQPTLAVIQYAGEKLLHATVLLLQMLFIVFAREGLVDTWPIKGTPWAVTAVTWSLNTVGLYIIVPATWCWIFAINEINANLWTNWNAVLAAGIAARKQSKEIPNAVAATPAEPPRPE